jgi:hypothetical protein
VLARGTAFYWDSHVWFVLSDPNHASGNVLCVNITTPGGICEDDECFLTNHDYSWITHKSVVAFSRAKVVDASQLEQVIINGLLKQPYSTVVPAETVALVAAKAKISKQLSREKRQLL